MARKVIPGGVQHSLACNYPFHIVITKAEGAKLYDIDGNWYYDLLQAGGPTMHFCIDRSKLWKAPQTLKETGIRQRETEHMDAAYMAEGIVTLAGSRLYTSAAYTEEMIDDVLARFDRGLSRCAPIAEEK